MVEKTPCWLMFPGCKGCVHAGTGAALRPPCINCMAYDEYEAEADSSA